MRIMSKRDVNSPVPGSIDAKPLYELAGAYSDLGNAPTDGADGSIYECTDSENVGKIYTFSEADNAWNYTMTLKNQ